MITSRTDEVGKNLIPLSHQSHILAHMGRDLERCNPDTEIPAAEGLDFLRGIFDAFTQIFFNMKTAIFGAFSKFKRSELQAFIQSNRNRVSYFSSTPTLQFGKFVIDIPYGMKTKYADAASELQSVYTDLDFHQTAILTSDLLDRMAKESSIEGYESYAKEIADLTKKIKTLTRKEVESRLSKHFASKTSIQKGLAEKFVGSHADLIEAKNTILDFEAFYKRLFAVEKNVDDINQKVRDIVAIIRSAPNVKMSFLKTFHAFITVLSDQADMTGGILDFCQRTEHNFVLAFRKIVKESKT